VSEHPKAGSSAIRIDPIVAAALADGRPVVALESTIFSNLGLPAPHNGEALERCLNAIAAAGATAALTAVLDGEAWVGVPEAAFERVLEGRRKVAERDLPVAVAQNWDVGVTTVSASLALAAAAGIRVFATGGIGGVHRDDQLTGDVSADLGAIARHPVICVSAGAKAFLDLAKTLERLDTLGVPVLGFRTGDFPAFYTRSSGLPVPHRVDTPIEAAAVLQARLSLGLPGGVLVCNPIPEADALSATTMHAALASALADASAAEVRGAQLTPFVLGRIAAATGGLSVPANLSLAEHNARIAAEIAVAYSLLR
jgi:pseudouridine-5'-phosphate glycosidase